MSQTSHGGGGHLKPGRCKRAWQNPRSKTHVGEFLKVWLLCSRALEMKLLFTRVLGKWPMLCRAIKDQALAYKTTLHQRILLKPYRCIESSFLPHVSFVEWECSSYAYLITVVWKHMNCLVSQLENNSTSRRTVLLISDLENTDGTLTLDFEVGGCVS